MAFVACCFTRSAGGSALNCCSLRVCSGRPVPGVCASARFSALNSVQPISRVAAMSQVPRMMCSGLTGVFRLLPVSVKGSVPVTAFLSACYGRPACFWRRARSGSFFEKVRARCAQHARCPRLALRGGCAVPAFCCGGAQVSRTRLFGARVAARLGPKLRMRLKSRPAVLPTFSESVPPLDRRHLWGTTSATFLRAVFPDAACRSSRV